LAREGLPDKATNFNSTATAILVRHCTKPCARFSTFPANRAPVKAFTCTVIVNPGAAVKFKLVSAMFGLILSMMLLLAVAVFFVLFSELAAM